MGHHNEGDADLFLQLGQFRAHLVSQLGIQRRKGLVQQQNAGPLDQGAGQSHPLTLPPRQLIGLSCAIALKLDQRQGLFDPAIAFGRRHAVDLEAIGDIVGDAHVGKDGIGLEHHIDRALVGRGLADILAVYQDAPLSRHFEPGKHAQQGGLATTGWPQKRKEFPLLNGQADIVDGHHLAIAFGDVLKTDDGLAGYGFGEGCGHVGRLT